jgi:hypothetical protein
VVEFAITAPVVLLMVLFGVDFGRVFLGWVTLNNAAREAADYASIYPTAWGTPGNPAAQDEFDRLITAEAAQSNCELPGTLPDPQFPNGIDIGSPTVVEITCQFSLITPLIGNILGSPIDVSASASFPVRNGAIAGIPSGGTLPSIGPGSSAPPATAAPPTPPTTAAPTTPVTTPVPTPEPICVVPAFLNANTSQATRTWTNAGFEASKLIFSPLVPPNFKIKTQTLPSGSSVPCSSTMTVSP